MYIFVSIEKKLYKISGTLYNYNHIVQKKSDCLTEKYNDRY